MSVTETIRVGDVQIARVLHEDDDVILIDVVRRERVHPDRHGGDRTLWDQVEQAGKVLGLIT